MKDYKTRLIISKIIDIGLLFGFIILSYKTIREIGVFIAMFFAVFSFLLFINIPDLIEGNFTGFGGEPDYASFFSKNPFHFFLITFLLIINLVLSFCKIKSIGRLICSIPNWI